MRVIGKGKKGGLAGALTRITGFSANLDWPTASNCYTQFFTDWIKQCSNYGVMNLSNVFQGGWTQDPTTGWPSGGVLANWKVRIFLFNSLSAGQQGGQYLRPGTYKARLSAAAIAAGWTCQFVETQSTGIATCSGAGTTCTMTIADQGTGPYGGMLIVLDCFSPTSGGPYSFNNTPVQAYLQSQESHLDAGNDAAIFDQDFLNDMVGVRMIRCKDWAGTDISAFNYPYANLYPGQQDRRKRGICAFSELVTDSWMTWQMPTNAGPVVNDNNWPGTGNVPYKIQAKLAKVLAAQNPDGKCGLMLHFPLMHNMNPFDVRISGNTFICYGHDFQNGDQVVLGGNFIPANFSQYTKYYARDVVAGVSWSLAATPGGAALPILADQNNASTYDCNAYKLYTEAQTQALYDAIAAVVAAEAPNIDIVSDVGNENWNATQPYGFDQCFHCLVVQAGAAANAGTGYAWALMRAWKAVEKYYPRSQHVRIFQGQAVFFNQISNSGYNYVDATLYEGKKLADLIDAHCNAPYVYNSLTGAPNNQNDGFGTMGYALAGSDYNYWVNPQTYVPGDIVHMSDGNNYLCILGNSGQTPPNATYWLAINPNSLVGSGTTWNDDQLLLYGLLSNRMTAYYQNFYKTQGDAIRTNPVPLGYVCYEGGPIIGNTQFNLGSNGPVFAAKWQTFMRTAKFQLYIQDYFNTCIKGTGVTSVCQYMFAGQWRNQVGANYNDSVAFGLKRGHAEADTFASAWFKKGTNVVY